MLATLVQMMIDFQWKEMEAQTDEGASSLLAYCLELTTLVAISEEFLQMQDFLFAAYTHSMTLSLIQANDVEKIKRVFADYTYGWDEEMFIETETLISGIEYASLVHTESIASTPKRIEGALNTILSMFDIPRDVRKAKIEKVLSMDYRAIGRKVYEGFKKYVTDTNEHALEEILKSTKIRTYK